MSKLLAWFGRFRQSPPVVEAAAGPAVPVRRIGVLPPSKKGEVQPDAEGGLFRVETEQISPGLLETRFYNPESGQAVKSIQVGTDTHGAPYQSRATYWAWGHERQRITTSVENGQPALEYIAYFQNGEVRLHKKRVGRKLTVAFADVPPRHGYQYKEEMPEYPGGKDKFLQDIQQGVKYPAIALRNQETGRVFVEFTVRADGWLDQLSIKKGVTPALDAAALQAVERLSHLQWRPGFQDRRAVAVVFTVPITFKI